MKAACLFLSTALAGFSFMGDAAYAALRDGFSNYSVRAMYDPDADHQFIVGFVSNGTASKQLLLRTLGPALAQYGIADYLWYPRFELYDSSGPFFTNGWFWNFDIHSMKGGDDGTYADITAQMDALFALLGASSLQPGSYDSDGVLTLVPQPYTSEVWAPTDNHSGVCLFEVYDADPVATDSHLINISGRAYVGTGDQVLIVGFVTNRPGKVMIRGVGPGILAQGVNNALADPVLTVYSGSTPIASSDDWGKDPTGLAGYAVSKATAADMQRLGAFALTTGSTDAAIEIVLPVAGAYTAIVVGKGGSKGTALVEAYWMGATQ